MEGPLRRFAAPGPDTDIDTDIPYRKGRHPMQALEPLILMINNALGFLAHAGSSVTSALSHGVGRF